MSLCSSNKKMDILYMKKKTILALSISSVLFASNINAANQVADARGNAMGNTGVASADYLTSPFYNPALGASFKDNDDFGLLLPAVGATLNDTDDTINTIDDLQSFYDNLDQSSLSPDDEEQLEAYLNELEDNKLSVTAGLGFAIAFPTNTVAVNFFGRGYTELIARVDVGDDSVDPVQRYDESVVDMLAFGYVEFGLALAKEFTLAGEKVSFGVTPKFQRLTTYAYSSSVDDFDIEDYDESEISEDAFNFDLGAMWYKDNFRVGIAAKDLISQEIDVADTTGVSASSDSYKLDTQVTVAVAYSADYFTAAIDADLTKQTRFQNVEDDTQYVRFGIEGDAWGWAQLRAGYEIDLEDTVDDTITAGIGISPYDVVSLDISGSYTGENQLGAAVNLAFTF